MAAARTFSSNEVGKALFGAVSVQLGFVVMLAFAGTGGKIKAQEEELPKEVPMAVSPVIDDELPLLKLGGNAKPKLPDAWKKQAAQPVPEPVEEAAGAPSPQAKDDPQAAAKTPVPKDAGTTVEPSDASSQATAQTNDNNEAPGNDEVSGPGSPLGSKDGTETDPLKARALDLYRQKLLAWFNARFKVPDSGVPCAELKTLKARVTATVGPDRSVRGYTLSAPSGNEVFDAKVRQTMEGAVGQELPPPPPNYPELDIGAAITPVFSGAGSRCDQPLHQDRKSENPLTPSEPGEPSAPKPAPAPDDTDP